MNLLGKAKLSKLNHYLITLLFMAQPFIVMFQATVVRDVQLFGFSIFEFFNIILALVSMGLCIYLYPEKEKFKKYIPYVVILGVYTLLHGWNIYQFDQSTYSLQSPNFLVESYYIFRTFIVPLLLLFDVYYSQMSKKQLLKILEIFIYVISIVCVLTNLLGVAQQNYSDATVYGKYNLFDWFNFENTYKYSYYDLTTKGWFLSGNQLSAILFMVYPVVLWLAYDKKSLTNYLLVILCTLSMFMLGTRTANMGAIIILVMFLVLYVLFRLLKQKSKSILFLLIVLISFGALFPFSPIGYKIKYEKNEDSGSSGTSSTLLESAMNVNEDEWGTTTLDFEKLAEQSIQLKNLDVQNMTEDDLIFVKEYMAEFCGFFGISPYILEHYNDLNHSRFWAKYMQETPNNDYRVLKTMILENIQRENQHPLDKLLGIGYTLNYIYTEADYTYQYYSYGIFGLMVLIGPYFAILGFVIFQGLKHFKKMFTLECAIYFIAPMLGLIAAKFSGHVLERSFPLMVMAWLLGILLVHTKKTCKEKMVRR